MYASDVPSVLLLTGLLGLCVVVAGVSTLYSKRAIKDPKQPFATELRQQQYQMVEDQEKQMMETPTGRVIQAVTIAGLVYLGWIGFNAFKEQERQAQIVAARPHEVRFLAYEVTLPRTIPEGFEGGQIFVRNFPAKAGHKGKPSVAHIAHWDIHRPARKYGGPPRPGGVEFMVQDAHSRPPKEWQEKLERIYQGGWKDLSSEPAGTVEVAGLKFAKTRWHGDLYARQPVWGVDYLANDGDHLIAIRGFTPEHDLDIDTIAQATLHSLRKSKPAATTARTHAVKP
jgi:hypothetical protein